jgi:spectrin beta
MLTHNYCICCRNAWQLLLEHVEARDRKLHGAGELHRFNRDVEEALSRIQEKYTSIPEDLGRDLKAVQSYIKQHEGFESDLVPLEAQVCSCFLLLLFCGNYGSD